VQVGLQLADLAAWTFGEHADRAHTDHDLAGWVDDVATSIAGNISDPAPGRNKIKNLPAELRRVTSSAHSGLLV
jgi:hypothetical protein